MTQQRRQSRTACGGRPSSLAAACFVLAASLLTALPALALEERPIAPLASDETVPKQLEGIRIEDKAGAQLPSDLHFKDQDGRDVTLGSYFDGKRPVVLVLAYYTCPMLCTVILHGIEEGLKQVAWDAGDKYRILTVSFDPRDTPAAAKAKRAELLTAYGRHVGPDAWDFLTGDAANIKRLADAIGFHYRWDPEQQQYAHAAGAFVLTAGGKVSRVFYGIEFPPNNLRLALDEASNGRFSTTADQVLLFCFHYDPKTGTYVLAASRLMKAGGVATVIFLSIFVGRYLRQESKRTSA